MLKKIIIIQLCLLIANIVKAQTVTEAKQAMYYERYQSAESLLHSILQNNSSDAEGWYWLTQAYLQQKNDAEAKDSLAKAPASIQNNPFIQVALGHLLLQSADINGATTFFDNALKDTKEKDEAILAAVAKAHIDATKGDATYAIELLQKAIKRDKRNPALYTALGDAYRKLDNGTEAYKAYQQALHKDSKYAAALTQLGNIFVTQKNSEMYLKFFNDAVATDSNYTPVYYDLYLHYYIRETKKALEYFEKYIAMSDYDAENEYRHTDLLYLDKQYEAAIQQAKKLINNDQAAAPRLYKMIAYSFQGLRDTAQALNYMQQYFAKAPDTSLVLKDFETMGDLYMTVKGREDSAAHFYKEALAMQKDSVQVYLYYQKLADLHKTLEDYPAEAKWLGKYYTGNEKATNIDLFNWGIAHYRAKEYTEADSTFGTYIQKYPEQGFGYYWRARSNIVRDSAMEKGLAIPHYQKVIEIAGADTANETNQKWLIEAYGYLAAYETNVEKDYTSAIDYFKKLLVIEPDNRDAEKYISMLQKNLNATGMNTDKNN